MKRCRIDSERVRSLIRAQHLKFYWVAEVSGIHRSTLRRWLTGKIDQVRSENVKRLAGTLSTTMGEITTGSRSP